MHFRSLLAVILLPLLITLISFTTTYHTDTFFTKSFTELNVYAAVPEADAIHTVVMTYFSSKEDGLIQHDFFTEREEIHLHDVKVVLRNTFLLFYFVSLLFFALLLSLLQRVRYTLKQFIKQMLVIVSRGSALTLALMVLLFTVSVFAFDFLFFIFHETFFVSGSYVFNPATEKIVVLYPEQLFFNALQNVLTKVIFSSVFSVLVSSVLLFYFFSVSFNELFPFFSRRKNT